MCFVGIFVVFVEELIEGVEKCCQCFFGVGWCNYQCMFVLCCYMLGLWLDSGWLFKGVKKLVVGCW